MKHFSRPMVCVIALSATLSAPRVAAAQDWAAVEINTTQVAPGLYMLTGRGGNMAVSVGDDGIFLVDDQYAPLTDTIVSAIRAISEAPIRFVLNTHWHGDHTGGNENLGATGTLVFAHDNVRRRMSIEQYIEAYDMHVDPSPEEALPVVTFGADLTFHFNGEEMHGVHVEHAHTDGDVVVFFRDANVVHMGDVYFGGIYPFIDVSSGGSLDGTIDASRRVLELIGDETVVIPGHGTLSKKAGLADYLTMLEEVRARIVTMIAAGKSREEVVAAKPTADWDEAWGGGWIGPDRFVEILYDDLARNFD